MMGMSSRAWQLPVVLIAAAFALLLGGCAEPPELPDQPFRKAIVTDLGEVTSNARYVGDTLRYRIYYANSNKRKVDIAIVDHLDSNLGKIAPSHGGIYDAPNHQVLWLVEGVRPGGVGYVEFEAVIAGGSVIRDQAKLQVGGRFDRGTLTLAPDHDIIKTNIVETLVRPNPELGWIPFDRVSVEGARPTAVLKGETTTGTLVRFDVPGLYAQALKAGDTTFHRLSVPRHSELLAIGKPALPIIGRLIEIPQDVHLTLEVVQSKSRQLDYYNVYPAQAPINRTGTGTPGPFVQDAATYTTDTMFPASLATVEAHDVGIIRGHRVVFLKVNPVQFNPVTREVVGYSMLEVRIKFNRPAQIQRASSRIESVAFEQLLKSSILNYKDPVRLAERGSHSEEGVDYLILTDASFYTAGDPNDPLNRLAAWKHQKGLTTRIVDVANIPGGNTAASITSYLEDAYAKWYPVPTYVLLVGDAEFIPTHYQTAHPTAHIGTMIGTDLYYATLDGTDYFPDLFLGRLSVDTAGELADVVNKIIDYEKTPPVNPAFYQDTGLAMLFEDDTDAMPVGDPPDRCPEDDQEDCTFRIVEFSEEIFAYLDGPDYNPQRIYAQSGATANPLRYEDTTNLPANLTVAGGFGWAGGTADIRTAINNGAFLMTFNGHGLRDGWGNPAFRSNPDVRGLTNAAQTPVVFSLTCDSGWFDNETDAADLRPEPGNQGTAVNDESFSEELLRHNNGGAVAVIGASRHSWGHNDFVELGLYTALWPDFDPDPPFRPTGLPEHTPGDLPEIDTGALYRIGQIHTFGKVYMANYFSADIHRQSTFELYHLFGDPEMGVWTEEPGRLNVDHPPGLGATGSQDFAVTVTDSATGSPLRSATVVLTRGGIILGVIQTNPAGIARFNLTAIGSDAVTVTVTARNYRPYEGTMTVNSGGAELNRLEPDNGPVGQRFHVGGRNFSGSEQVDLTFGREAPVAASSAAGSFGQVGATAVDINVPAAHTLGPVNVLAQGKTSNRYGVDVFQVRSANPIDLYTYDQWNDTTWHLHPGDNPTWNNPEIQLYDSTGNPVASNNLVAGTTYTIKATIHNDTDFRANDVTMTFKWANFGVGQSERDWQEIDVDTVDVLAHSRAEAEVSWAPPGTGHLCILADIYHIEDINTGNNRGQENTHVGPTSSAAKVPFMVANPTKEPGYMHLELRQIRTVSEQSDLLWESWIRQPDPQLLKPGERREAWVIIDPAKADVRPGDEAEFSLTGSIRGKIVGGVNFTIQEK